MRPSRLLLALPLLAGILVLGGMTAAGLAPAQADITIIGDDDQDAFVGSGSLLLPPQIATDWREVAATCPGCNWRSVIQ
jgi:hypothetical protein